jgi:hypothetical protein
MFFLPSTCFAVSSTSPFPTVKPLIYKLNCRPLSQCHSRNWSSTSIVTGKSCVYWAVTILATILELVVWILWHVFDEWKSDPEEGDCFPRPLCLDSLWPSSERQKDESWKRKEFMSLLEGCVCIGPNTKNCQASIKVLCDFKRPVPGGHWPFGPKQTWPESQYCEMSRGGRAFV